MLPTSNPFALLGELGEDEVQQALGRKPRERLRHPNKVALNQRNYRERLAADTSEAGIKKLEDVKRKQAAADRRRYEAKHANPRTYTSAVASAPAPPVVHVHHHLHYHGDPEPSPSDSSLTWAVAWTPPPPPLPQPQASPF